jgi:hypothetical protein
MEHLRHEAHLGHFTPYLEPKFRAESVRNRTGLNFTPGLGCVLGLIALF